MATLVANADEWWKRGPVGFVDDEDPDHDPLWGLTVEPPAGYERLPFHEEVSDGE